MMLTFLFISGNYNSKLSNYRSRNRSFIKKVNREKQIRFYSTKNKDMCNYLNP